MPRRLAGRAAAPCAALALALAGCGGAPAALPALRPHIVVILVDALRADRLGVNGYALPTTPEIDRLAAEGVNFSAAFAHSTWTKPSIATLFTSLYPSQHGLARVGEATAEGFESDVLPDGLVTLAEGLRGAGYATGAVINQVHLQERFGFAQGFDHFEAVRGRNARQLNRKLRAWLESAAGAGEGERRPLFAYLHYLDVHWPYTQRLSGKRFGPVAMRSKPPHRADRTAEWLAAGPPPSDFAALAARYDHEVAWADAAIGEVVATLEELGLWETTVLVVTSDHGEGFLEHGELQHGYAPYDELLRVPLVMRLPQPLRRVTGSIDSPVGLVDVMPTLLELAGAEPVPGVQGESLAPLLAGGRARERSIFSQAEEAVAVRTSTRKLIRHEDGRIEFYDLAADPGERQPLPCEAACRDLARRLGAFREAMIAAAAVPPGTAAMDAEDVEALRALGYLD